MIINKKDFINQLVEEHDYTKKSATELVNDFWDVMLKNVRDGNDVQFYGIGTFCINKRAKRSCPNPQTGEECIIPEHYVMKFHVGDSLRRAVKEWEDDTKRGLI